MFSRNKEEQEAQYRKERELGEQARRILDDPMYQNAFQTVGQGIVDKWKSSPARDPEGREALWNMLHLLNTVHKVFEETLTTGKLAEKSLTEIEKRGRRRAA